MATKASTKQANLTRAQKIQNHEEATKDREAQARELKLAYEQAASGVVLQDILKKMESFIKYFEKIAKDGMGGKVVGKDENRNDIIEEYRLTPEERLSNLDKASGIESLQAYILAKATPVIEPVVAPVSNDDDAEGEDTDGIKQETQAQ